MTVPGKVFTREEIISTIWKDAVVGDRTKLMFTLEKLEKKLVNKSTHLKL